MRHLTAENLRMRNWRVLLVDDDRYEAREYATALADAGFDVEIAGSVVRAMRRLDADDWDVAVLDVRMAHGRHFRATETAGGWKTGLAFARELKARIPDLRLVALTSSIDPEVEAWFSQDESVAYFSKSEVPPVQLAHRLRLFLEPDSERPVAFVVHGRDTASVQELTQLLRQDFKIDEILVLSELASAGGTVIEKFEQHARRADIAFVLLTPDDVAYLASDPTHFRHQARPNVLLELGYFLALLKRRSGRVLILKKGEVDIPSDVTGLTYVDISHGIAAAANRIRFEIRDLVP